MFIGADLSLCIQGHQERREKDCKKKGNGGVELRGAVIGTFPFFRTFLTYRGPNDSGHSVLFNHTLTIYHSFLMWFSL